MVRSWASQGWRPSGAGHFDGAALPWAGRDGNAASAPGRAGVRWGDQIGTMLMRRTILGLLAALVAAPAAAPAAAQGGQPPHAWLFGTWTGGIFPVSSSLPPQTCLSQPVVIFTRDLVMRATLTEQTLTQREIQTARAIPGGMEFRLTSTGAAPGALVRGARSSGSPRI